MHKTEPWRYEKLTWPEVNDAVRKRLPVVVPIGSIEQHGPHLPLDVDMLEVTTVAQAAARLIPNDVLVLPTQVNGYTGHVMDFPGTINIHFETLIRFMPILERAWPITALRKSSISMATARTRRTWTWSPDASISKPTPRLLRATGGRCSASIPSL